MNQEPIPIMLRVNLEEEIEKALKVVDELIIDERVLKTDFQQTYDYLKEKGYDITRINHYKEAYFLKQSYRSLKIRRTS